MMGLRIRRPDIKSHKKLRTENKQEKNQIKAGAKRTDKSRSKKKKSRIKKATEQKKNRNKQYRAI